MAVTRMTIFTLQTRAAKLFSQIRAETLQLTPIKLALLSPALSIILSIF